MKLKSEWDLINDQDLHRMNVYKYLLKLSRLCQRWDLKFLMFWASSK